MKLLFENWRQYLKEDVEDMLKLSFKDFDQPESGKGWRTIKDPTEQATIMQKYIDIHKDDIDPGNLSLLMWHMAQALAYGNENQKAAEIMEAVVGRQKGSSAEEIIDYGLATIYFLKGDSESLNKIYSKYQERIEQENPKDFNMNIINCMKRCAGKGNYNYSIAYQADIKGCKC